MRLAGAIGERRDSKSLVGAVDACQRARTRALYREHELKRRSLAIQANRLLIEALLNDEAEVSTA